MQASKRMQRMHKHQARARPVTGALFDRNNTDATNPKKSGNLEWETFLAAAPVV